MAGTSRVNREVYARFCGRLVVKFLRPTRRLCSPVQILLRQLAVQASSGEHFCTVNMSIDLSDRVCGKLDQVQYSKVPTGRSTRGVRRTGWDISLVYMSVIF